MNMKKIWILGLVGLFFQGAGASAQNLSTSAGSGPVASGSVTTDEHGQEYDFYYNFDGQASISGSPVHLGLSLNDKVERVSFGDPEIPGHGFYRDSLNVTVTEGNENCKRKLELENGEITLCSGRKLNLISISALGTVASCSKTCGGLRFNIPESNGARKIQLPALLSEKDSSESSHRFILELTSMEHDDHTENRPH